MRSELPSGYVPQPISVDAIRMDEEMLALIERLARNAHDVWAAQRLADGWTWGVTRSDVRKEHPGLVRFDELPESEKEYDRVLVRSTLEAVLALGYRVLPPASRGADADGA